MNEVYQKIINGYLVTVDLQDKDLLDSYSWSVTYTSSVGNVTFYVRRCVKRNYKRTWYRLHRAILGVQNDKSIRVDHIDGNGLNNRRSNLRLATRSQNAANSHNSTRVGSSKYKGVYWNKARKKWIASIRVNYDPRYLGLFAIEEDAARAYNKAAIEAFGEYAKVNVIDD